MEASWIGKAVSIQCCDKLGVFQGTIKDANSLQITIVRAFRNGVPLRKQDAEVTLSASDIVKLELIPASSTQCTVSTKLINNPTPVKQPNFGRALLATLSPGSGEQKSCESALTHKISKMKLNGHRRSPPSNSEGRQQQKPSPVLNNGSNNKSPLPSSNVAKFFGNMIPPKVEVKLGTLVAQPQGSETNGYEISNGSNRSMNGVGGGGSNNVSKPIDIMQAGRTVNTPLKKERKKSRREARYNKNQTFGTPVDDPIMDEDFDFEGNLALFDKQAIWDAIDSVTKPDLVRVHQRKYRHDENVLASEPTQYRQIQSHCLSSHDFITDEGLIIPAIPTGLRSRIQHLAEENGLTWPRQCDLLARGATDLSILLLGGARRLTPNNQHQWPTIVIISDKPHNAKVSEVAAATGRHLASHGLKVMLYMKGQGSIDRESTEVELFRATGNKMAFSLSELSSSDLVILSVNSNNLSPSIKKWIVDNRSPVLAIDPPPNGVTDITLKCSIVPILPQNNIAHVCGKLYLCNLGIPDKYFRDAGIKYKSPFGHKFVIPIHMND